MTSWSESPQATILMTNLTKFHSFYLGPGSFLENLGGHAKFYILTASEERLSDITYDETLIGKESKKDISYPNQINRIKAKIEALCLVVNGNLKVDGEIPKASIDVFSYARMVTRDIRNKPNAWGKAVVSVCFMVLRESSLNQSDLVRPA